VAYRSFNFTSFKLEVSEKLPQGLTLLFYYQSLVMFLNIAKLDNTEESVDVGIGIFLLNVVVSAGENELATHLDAGKSLEP
jgi:hypothetical protein